MAYYFVPGVSIAVVDGGKLVWAQAFGVRKAGTEEPLTPDTMMQAASISKVFAALGAMRLVQEGKLNLDEDVNQGLSSWKLPDSPLAAGERVTVRRILSHTAGLGVHGFDGYPRGAAMPSLRDILDGRPPATNAAIRIERAPGSGFEYSGGGYAVMQQLIEDRLGESEAAYLNRAVLRPLEMSRSVFETPLSPDRLAGASWAHDWMGRPIEGQFHEYPTTGASGLWTTPRDLARLIIEVQSVMAGAPGKVVSQGTLGQMLTVVSPPLGLGFWIEGEGAARRFSHDGGGDGNLSRICAYVEGGKGYAIILNGRSSPELLFEIARGIAAAFDWPDRFQVVVDEVQLSKDQLARVVGEYRLPVDPPSSVHLEADEGRVRMWASDFGDKAKVGLIATSESTFVSRESAVTLRLKFRDSGPAAAIVIQNEGEPVEARRADK
jgi:CubicO group peptidase (beta-lactamase class C family)